MPETPPCHCRLCDPRATKDPHEKKAIDDVDEHFVHIICVSAGEAPDEPAFAYTVGLWHQARHPELVMSGQRIELMHWSLNEAVKWVRAGRRLTPGMSLEGVIGGFPVAVEAMTRQAADETVSFSGWFHRRPVDAVQLVWTDLQGIWPWQPGAHELIGERQPQSWRVPSTRTGALAADPGWELPVPADTLVFSCGHLEEGAPVAIVVRERKEGGGEDWQVLCELDHQDLPADDIRLVHLAHLVRAAPSLRDLADLGLDECAERERPWEAWRRSPLYADSKP